MTDDWLVAGRRSETTSNKETLKTKDEEGKFKVGNTVVAMTLWE
jgi:hypothetical protein